MWLNNFLGSQEAPIRALDALQPGQSEHVQFFLCNFVLTAIKQHWSHLNDDVKMLTKQRTRYSATHASFWLNWKI